MNTEIGKIAETIERIVARRQERSDNAWLDIRDELQGLLYLVTNIDRLYVELLEDIRWAFGPDGEDENREALIREVEHFLNDDRLLQQLTRIDGAIAALSQLRGLRPRKYRDLVEDLRGLERSVHSYQVFVRQVHDRDHQFNAQGDRLWNLADVLALLRGEGEQLPPDERLSVREMCEEAIRNRRRDLTEAIARLSGRAGQRVSGRNL